MASLMRRYRTVVTDGEIVNLTISAETTKQQNEALRFQEKLHASVFFQTLMDLQKWLDAGRIMRRKYESEGNSSVDSDFQLSIQHPLIKALINERVYKTAARKALEAYGNGNDVFMREMIRELPGYRFTDKNRIALR